jgi:hypothetical protein
VGNEENEYPDPDHNKIIINIVNELRDAHKKNLSKRKSQKRSLRNSWRSYQTRLTRIYNMKSKNINT